jgi:drug/metabolite transporter (DMT)-like permease
VKNWVMFGVLGLIWGSSFLLIKIGGAELSALELVSGRLGIAAIAFTIMFLVTRKRIPSDTKTRLGLLLVGLTNTAFPFVLITWGEQTIDSGLAGVLNATVPLFSFVIAHFALVDDKISTKKIMGLIAGFVGVVILAMRTADPNHPNSLEGQLAVLAAAVFYAFSAVFIRRNLRHVDSIVTAGTTLTAGGITVILVTLLTVHPLTNPATLSTTAIFSVICLGLANTFVAYILYFTLIRNWGASRSTLVTYTMPPISLLLGVIFNNEHVDVMLIIGAALIIGGVAIVNIPKAATRRLTSRFLRASVS